MKQLLLTTFKDGDCNVELWRRTKHTYEVVYGLHIVNGVSLELAMIEYGECVIHSLTCAGKLD